MASMQRIPAGRFLMLGVAGGLRSCMPLAAVVRTHSAAPAARGWRRWPVLRHSWGRALVIGMAAAELVGDKLPVTPSRLAPPALLGRVAAAAVAGAALATDAGRTQARGALARGTLARGTLARGTPARGTPARGTRARGAALAAAGAVAGGLGGYWSRRGIVTATRLPDPVVALLEDAAAIALSRAAAKG